MSEMAADYYAMGYEAAQKDQTKNIKAIKEERYNQGFFDGYKQATEQANAVIEKIKNEIEEIEIPEDIRRIDCCFAFCHAVEIADDIVNKYVNGGAAYENNQKADNG